jgi:two-component system, cell cycle sensor histidine kinase and response regulator CckA
MTFSSVLLIDDDEDDFLLTRTLLQEASADPVTVDWAQTYERGLSSLLESTHDVALIDYRLGKDNGVELLRTARACGCTTPLIMLTGDSDGRVDHDAMDAGADDYLVKGQVTAPLLERSLRYALEHRRVLDLLKDREEHLRAVLENSSDVIALLDPEGTVLYASNAIERLFGYPASQVVGRSTFELIHPDDQPRIRAASTECLAAPGNRIRAEYRAKHSDGTWRDWEMIAVNRLDNPAVGAVISNYRDITERKQAQARGEFLATIVDSSEDAILGATLEGLIVSWNPGAERLYGYTAAEMIGQPVNRIVPSEHPDEVSDILARLRRGGHFSHYETVRLAKNGHYIDVAVTISPIIDASGVVIGKSSVARDITERKRAELEQRDTSDRLRALLSSAPIALWAVDSAGIITVSEGMLLRQLGVKPGELVGRSVFDLYRDSPEIVEFARKALAGERINTTMNIAGAILDTWYSPLLNVNGRPGGTIGVALDVTERHRLEGQFRQAQRMEAVGQLAGGIAHDFNNLLTAILGFAEMTLTQLPDGQMRDDVQQILNAGHSAASLTRQLLAFSRKQILAPQILDMNALLGGMRTLLRRVIGEDIALVTTLSDEVSQINADRGQIEQVIMNLAVNARDAIAANGTLRLVTENVEVNDGFAAAHRGALTGPHVRVTVSDTGSGMGPDVLAHLFEPFYTTKPAGKGTGLGLATVYGIVKQSGGYIWVESTPGEGTSFMIHFPRVSPEAETTVPVGTDAREVSRTETILLVEDQREVRGVVRQALQRHGYHVLEAVDGQAALALLRAGAAPIHLLLTDVVMPHISGRELVHKITQQDPSIRVLYTSGYTDDAIVRHGVLDPGIAFIQKPFTPEQLLTRVRDVLGRPDRS